MKPTYVKNNSKGVLISMDDIAKHASKLTNVGSNSGDDDVGDVTQGQNTVDKGKLCTLTFEMAVGRHLYTRDTTQILSQMHQILDTLSNDLGAVKRRLTTIEKGMDI